MEEQEAVGEQADSVRGKHCEEQSALPQRLVDGEVHGFGYGEGDRGGGCEVWVGQEVGQEGADGYGGEDGTASCGFSCEVAQYEGEADHVHPGGGGVAEAYWDDAEVGDSEVGGRDGRDVSEESEDSSAGGDVHDLLSVVIEA